MASVQKFTDRAVVNQLRHNERATQNPSNPDIDMTRSHQNYTLSQDRGMTSYDYYKQRKAELYCYKRDDVKTLAGWVVTAPKDLPLDLHEPFFKETYRFLENRYGKENTVLAVVHNDESGQPHLHYNFIPAVDDAKHGGQKICANDVLNRQELRNFHPALQKHLKEIGIDARVINGATAGGNRTVRELKREREHVHQRRLTF